MLRFTKSAALVFFMLAFTMASFVNAADPVRKVVNDIKQTTTDVGKAGSAAVEKSKEVLTNAAAATTQTGAIVEKDTVKAKDTFMEKLKDFGSKLKKLFSK